MNGQKGQNKPLVQAGATPDQFMCAISGMPRDPQMPDAGW